MTSLQKHDANKYPIFCLAALIFCTAASVAHAGSEAPILTFPKANGGGQPVLNAQPAFNKGGQLFGTAGYGLSGANRYGSVFRLSPPKPGSTVWGHSILYSFKGGVPNSTDGYGPFDGVSVGTGGVLYGFTAFDGPSNVGGCGIAYQLTPPAKGQTTWTYAIIYRFQASDPNDGCNPENEAPLIASDGSLFGTTVNGGGPPYNVGTLFQLHPPANGSTTWTETVLWRFRAGIVADGSNPMGSVVADSAGNLFGTASAGGNSELGTVWEYTLATGAFLKLHDFLGGADGATPMAGLAGPLGGPVKSRTYYYGTTMSGGGASACGGGCGTLFDVTLGAGGATEGAIHAFAAGTDGAAPVANLYSNSSGLWGTTSIGGTGQCNGDAGCGTIFNLAFTRFSWTYGVSYSFQLGGGDGQGPQTGLTGDTAGNLFGMTQYGGKVGGAAGTVFEFTP